MWKIDTDIGRFWFKENCTPHRAEGDVHSVAARLAPSYVDEPVGVDGDRGWLLTRDGGVTLMDAAPGGSRGIEGEALVRLLEDYGRMQRMTVGRWKDFHSAGLRIALPRDAAEMSRRQVEWMTSTAEDDPRQLTAEQRQAVLDAAPALEEAGDVLADGPVPLALDHCDLFPRNVFLPRTQSQPYRFFDFAEAVWAHPFGSLVMLVWECVHRWSITQPEDRIDLRDSRVRVVFDAYLDAWTDLAPLEDLRALVPHALRIAPPHRSWDWLQVLNTADERVLAKHGRTP